jgi:hypothetical protein
MAFFARVSPTIARLVPIQGSYMALQKTLESEGRSSAPNLQAILENARVC